MKKIKILFISLFCLIAFPSVASAASGKITVASSSTVVVGNNVVVTVTISSATSIGSWEMSLNYDKNYLQLKSTNAESNGNRMAASSSTGIKSKSYTFTFKTLKKGSTKVVVDSYLAYAFDDLSQITLTSSSKTINIITQAELEASYSKNNSLKTLEVEGFTLTPEFNADTLEYNLVVPEGTKEVNIIASLQDKTASVTGDGTKTVVPGTNKFEIVVRAQSGAEKTYVVNVEVKDENPINVEVDGKNYTVVKLKENLPEISLYAEYIVKINDFDIPAYKNEYTNLVLVGLKDEEGSISLFIYDEESSKYTPYYEIGVNKITIYPLESSEEIKGYTKGEIEINGILVKGYYYKKDSNYVIIYGVNVETGDKGFYMYDKKMQSLINYNDEYVLDLNKKVDLYTYIIFGFSGVLVLMIIIIIILTKKKGKKKDKRKNLVNDKPKEIKNEKLEKNTIVET